VSTSRKSLMSWDLQIKHIFIGSLNPTQDSGLVNSGKKDKMYKNLLFLSCKSYGIRAYFVPAKYIELHMESNTVVKLSRKNFLRKSAIGLTALSFANGLFPVVGKTNNGPLAINKENMISGDTYKIKNVRLETGFEYENGEVVGTKTKLFTVEIASG